MKKPLIALGLTLAFSTFGAHAQSHQGSHQHQHHQSIAAINLVIATVDESNAANLQSQVDAIAVLRADLGTLVDAQPQDQATISMAYDALRQARDLLSDDVDALLSNDVELQDTVRNQAEQEHETHRLVATALRIDENFELLLSAATEKQAAELIANQLALAALRDSISEARKAGADCGETHSTKHESRETFKRLYNLASEVIASNAELSAQLSLNF